MQCPTTVHYKCVVKVLISPRALWVCWVLVGLAVTQTIVPWHAYMPVWHDRNNVKVWCKP